MLQYSTAPELLQCVKSEGYSYQRTEGVGGTQHSSGSNAPGPGPAARWLIHASLTRAMALEIEPSVNAPVAHSLYHAYLLILVLLDPRPIGRTHTMLTPHAIRQARLRDRAPRPVHYKVT